MTSSQIWNCDETVFATAVGSKKVLARRGSRNVYEIGGGSGHEYITMLVCGSADAIHLPPFILYKGKNLYNTLTKNEPAGCIYGTSKSGWIFYLMVPLFFFLMATFHI